MVGERSLPVPACLPRSRRSDRLGRSGPPPGTKPTRTGRGTQRMRRRIRHPRSTRSRDTCSGKRRAVKGSASLRLLLVDCREDLPHLVRLGLSFVVLNVHARVAGPRRLENGMGSARGARRAEVMFTNLVEILVADAFGVVSHARDDLVHGRHPLMVPRAVPLDKVIARPRRRSPQVPDAKARAGVRPRAPTRQRPRPAFPLVRAWSSVSTQSAPGGIRTPNLLIRNERGANSVAYQRLSPRAA